LQSLPRNVMNYMVKHNDTSIRAEFPILGHLYHGRRLAYLDNAATSQKPKSVLHSVDRFSTHTNANIHRGIYLMSEQATKMYEESKRRVAAFVHVPSWETIVYTRNTTESINTAALMLASYIEEGDEILVPIMEHHSNLIPWMQLAKRLHAKLQYIPLAEDGSLALQDVVAMMNKRTKLLAFCHISNVLGTITPVQAIAKEARKRGIITVVDGAQAVGHVPVDIAKLGVDVYAWSGHKMFAPFGIGVLYMRRELLENLDPIFYGGDMISHVEKYNIVYNDLPWKFEAGTPNVSGAVGLSAAVQFIEEIGILSIESRIRELTQLCIHALKEISGIRIYGPLVRGGIISFSIDGVHPHDLAALLDVDGVCIRAGLHCAEPLLEFYGCNSLARISIQCYNNEEDIAQCIASIKKVIAKLR